MKCLRCLQSLGNDPTAYGLHLSCFTTWFKVQENAKFLSLIRRTTKSDSGDKVSPENTSFFHGKFKKYSAELEGESYILKMREPKAPELPEVEYVCNQIASLLSIPVAKHFVIDFEGDRVFVTKNFVRSGSGAMNLSHVYHFRPDDQHTCETLVRVIKEQTKRPYDVGVFVDTILFDALVGNHDRHGRNLGFIVTPGKVELAPIYDNVSYLGLESGSLLKADFNPFGRIATHHTVEPSMKDYVLEFQRLDFKDRVKDFWSRIKFTNIEGLIHRSFCSDLMKDALKRLITKRYKELEDVTKNG